jgi:hypothetical protein
MSIIGKFSVKGKDGTGYYALYEQSGKKIGKIAGVRSPTKSYTNVEEGILLLRSAVNDLKGKGALSVFAETSNLAAVLVILNAFDDVRAFVYKNTFEIAEYDVEKLKGILSDKVKSNYELTCSVGKGLTDEGLGTILISIAGVKSPLLPFRYMALGNPDKEGFREVTAITSNKPKGDYAVTKTFVEGDLDSFTIKVDSKGVVYSYRKQAEKLPTTKEI